MRLIYEIGILLPVMTIVFMAALIGLLIVIIVQHVKLEKHLKEATKESNDDNTIL